MFKREITLGTKSFSAEVITSGIIDIFVRKRRHVKLINTLYNIDKIDLMDKDENNKKALVFFSDNNQVCREEVGVYRFATVIFAGKFHDGKVILEEI